MNHIEGTHKRRGTTLVSDVGRCANTRHLRRIVNLLFAEDHLNYTEIRLATNLTTTLTDALSFLMNMGIIRLCSKEELSKLIDARAGGKVYRLTNQTLNLYLTKQLKGGTK